MITVTLIACTKKQTSPETTTAAVTPAAVLSKDQLIEKGHQIYQMNCLSCHGGNPKIDGPIGPAIAGSSMELITMRVTELKYPTGYKPKRTTTTIIALPHLKNEIPAVFEYLSSVK